MSPVAAQQQLRIVCVWRSEITSPCSFEGPKEEDLAARALESLDQGATGASAGRSTPILTRRCRWCFTRPKNFATSRGRPPWAAGAFDGAIRVPMRGALEKTEELDRVLAHEFTHALIRTLATRGVPTWLNEGLAAALERESTDWAEKRVEQAGGFLPSHVWAHRSDRSRPKQAELAYSTSAVAARRMLDAAGGVAVSNLLRDLGEGQPFDAAFLHRMQRPFAEFAASLGESELMRRVANAIRGRGGPPRRCVPSLAGADRHPQLHVEGDRPGGRGLSRGIDPPADRGVLPARSGLRRSVQGLRSTGRRVGPRRGAGRQLADARC